MLIENNQIIIEKYRILNNVYDNPTCEIYKGEILKSGNFVMLKFIKPDMTTTYVGDRIRFKRENEKILEFFHSNIMKVYDSGEYNGILFVAYEWLEGNWLKSYFESRNRISIADSLYMIEQLIDAVAYSHSMGILHQDIKSYNIFVIDSDKVRKQLKLCDFGISFLLEYMNIPSEDISEIFGYMSPESTGIFNRKEDERSDLYSIGVVLYKFLCNRLPFEADSVDKIVYKQIAVSPENPKNINPKISSTLADIVMKLLNKDPDLRYQSTEGLLYDIKRIQNGERNFIIGEKDKKVKLSYKTKIIGRNKELKNLQEIYENVPGICFLSGELGIGKSTLISDFKNYVYKKGGTFLYSRCIQQENKIPYQPFKDILDGYISDFLKYDKEFRIQEEERLRTIADNYGENILKLNPNMFKILGAVKKITELEKNREQKRFLMSAADFLINLAPEGRHCVICIEDFQWADSGSLSLILELISMIKLNKVMILCSYRKSAESENKQFAEFINSAMQGENFIEKVEMRNFTSTEMIQFVSEILGQKKETSVKLAEYVIQKTGGNPFYATNMIRNFVEDKAIVWEDGVWKEDWDHIRRFSVTDNMVEVIIKRTQKLSQNAIDMLTVAAVIGIKFNIRLLFRILGENKENIVDMIDQGISFNFVEKNGDKGEFIFSHDKIRDSFLEKIGEEEAKNIHMLIAQVLEEDYIKNIGSIDVFSVVYHYSKAGDEIGLRKYIMDAAELAKESYANDEAIYYYKTAIDIIEKNNEDRSGDWIKANKNLASVYLLVGKYDKAISISEDTMKFIKEKDEIADVLKCIGVALFKKGQFEKAEEILIKGLGYLDEKVPKRRINLIIGLAKEVIIRIINDTFKKTISDKKLGNNEKEKKKIGIYIPLNWMYILNDTLKFSYVSFRMLHVAEAKIGNSKELILCTSSFGSMCMSIPLFGKAEKYHKISMEYLSDTDRYNYARSIELYGYYCIWSGQGKLSKKYLEEAAKILEDIGDMWELGVVLNGMASAHIKTGEYDKGATVCRRCLEIGEKIKDDYGVCTALANLCLIYCESGDYKRAEKYGKRALEMCIQTNQMYAACFTNIYFGILKTEMGEYDDAINHLDFAKKLYEENNFLKEYVCSCYTHLAIAYIEKYKSLLGFMTRGEKKKYLKTIKKLCEKALKTVKHWPNYQAQANRAYAMYFSLTYSNREAEKYFNRGVETAAKWDRKYEISKTHYEFSLFLESRKLYDEAKYHMFEAYIGFRKIASEQYSKRCIDHIFTEYRSDYKEADVLALSATAGKERLNIDRKMNTILKIGQKLSSILELEELEYNILEASVEMVGAERGILFLYNGKNKKEFNVEALYNIDKYDNSVCEEIVSKSRQEQKQIIVEDAQTDERIDRNSKVNMMKFGIKSILTMPIMVRGEMLGIIYLDSRMASGIFYKEYLEILGFLASQAGVSIENAKLYKRAITDALTGIYNRGYFENILMSKFEEAENKEIQPSILMIDIDFFKKCNDNYGHTFGDKVLNVIANVIKEVVGNRGIVCRYGGEEFAVIMDINDKQKVINIANNICRFVSEEKIIYQDETKSESVSITVSIGVAFWKEGIERTQFFENADKSLYLAKRNGRNRIYYEGQE